MQVRSLIVCLFIVISVAVAGAEIKAAAELSIIGQGYCFNSTSSMIRDEMANLKKGEYIAVVADAETLDVVNSVVKIEKYPVVEKTITGDKTRYVIEVQ